jgi:predicted CopG family antitoxin
MIMMPDFTTIQIERTLLELLKRQKEHPRQSYNEVIGQLLKWKKSSQYDRYIHEIQKGKMRELWNNKDDEAWEHV